MQYTIKYVVCQVVKQWSNVKKALIFKFFGPVQYNFHPNIGKLVLKIFVSTRQIDLYTKKCFFVFSKKFWVFEILGDILKKITIFKTSEC